MPIGNLALQGQPNLPYTDNRGYAGTDAFVDLTFLDHTQTPVIPTLAWYQLDDLTNAQNMIPQTTIVPVASTFTLQIPGASLQMTYPWSGSQICQLTLYFKAIDSVTGQSFNASTVAILELIAIQTPTGTTIP